MTIFELREQPTVEIGEISAPQTLGDQIRSFFSEKFSFISAPPQRSNLVGRHRVGVIHVRAEFFDFGQKYDRARVYFPPTKQVYLFRGIIPLKEVEDGWIECSVDFFTTMSEISAFG